MQVAYVARYGAPEIVELRELPTPLPKAGELRIRVLATAVTSGDWRVQSGVLPRGFGALRGLALGWGGPRKGVLGTDAAGVVDMVGKGVTRFSVGDAVVAFPGSAMGAHATQLIMPATGRVAKKPAHLSFEEAAALPFGAMTALDFFRRAALRAGEHVLVNGASGNVGSIALQLAKHMGARVTAVCSGGNSAMVRALGADEVIDYTTTDFATTGARYDVVMDTVGNAPYARVRPALAEGGRLLAVLADLPAILVAPFVGGAARHRVIAGPAAEKAQDLETVMELAERGALVPVIAQRFPFQDIAEAFRVVASGRKRGSVIVTIEGRSEVEPAT